MLQTLIRPDRINIHKTSTTPIFRFPLDLLPEPLFGIIQVTARLTHPSGVKQSRVVLRGLSHNRCRTLAGILALAFVFGELDPETLLRVGNPLHGTQGHFELAIAKSTDSDSGHCAHPFDDPETALWHGLARREQFQHRRLLPTGHPSEHSARFHFEDSKCRLQFMDGLSNFWVFTNLVPQGLQQIMSSSHMLCCLSRAGVRFGFALRLHDAHLSGRILVLASMGMHPRSQRR
jgi:hypothetical protein